MADNADYFDIVNGSLNSEWFTVIAKTRSFIAHENDFRAKLVG